MIMTQAENMYINVFWCQLVRLICILGITDPNDHAFDNNDYSILQKYTYTLVPSTNHKNSM